MEWEELLYAEFCTQGCWYRVYKTTRDEEGKLLYPVGMHKPLRCGCCLQVFGPDDDIILLNSAGNIYNTWLHRGCLYEGDVTANVNKVLSNFKIYNAGKTVWFMK